MKKLKLEKQMEFIKKCFDRLEKLLEDNVTPITIVAILAIAIIILLGGRGG